MKWGGSGRLGDEIVELIGQPHSQGSSSHSVFGPLKFHYEHDVLQKSSKTSSKIALKVRFCGISDCPLKWYFSYGLK
jgi:hypothetical protein